ncbi:MAG TPA: wax ester/triacylglycerol synthase domain-containing protein [Acidimicrobiales bacterium]|nr:wax ester/triacylglycerol synthase domain-containing protein [Acidimicrobiales bacterium]
MSVSNAERRMTDAEALMWSLDADPALRSSFISITFLDGTPDFERFRQRVASAVETTPALRHRVASSPFDLLAPRWEPDPAFDLDFHVRRVAVPSPGSHRQVLDLAALAAQDPFDQTRPLWQFTVVEGLSGGQAALVAKMHHVLSDGVGAVRMSAAFVDLSPDPDEPEGSGRVHRASEAPSDEAGASAGGGLSALLGTVGEAAGSVIASNAGWARRAAAGVFDTVRKPQQLPSEVRQTVAVARSLARQLAVIEPAHSTLWTGNHSFVHRFDALSIDLDEVRAAAKVLGGTVNDVLVTAVAGAAGAYHRARRVDVADLRMSMPVSTRHDRAVGGNAWAPTRVLVPVVGDPLTRFKMVHERLETTKHEASLGLTGAFAGILRAVPTPMVVRLARQQVGTVDFACSNVRGAPFDLWVAGARVVATYPMGPTAGTAFNATVLSYRDHLDLGLNADSGAVDDPQELRDLIASGFAELIDASRSGPAT